MPTPGAPLNHINENDKSGLVLVVAVIMCLLALGCAIVRFVQRLFTSKPQNHDIVLAAGAAIMIANTACIVLQCKSGLGRHVQDISQDSLVKVAQLQYAYSFLYLGLVTCTKLSLCLLAAAINIHEKFNIVVWCVQSVLVAYFVSGCFAIAFQCPAPQQWFAQSPMQCPAAQPVYLYIGVMDIVTDIALSFLPVLMVWKVQTTLRKKLQVFFLFGSRIVVPVAVIYSLLDTQHLFYDREYDSTWTAVAPMTARQVAAGLSVITACIPNMKSFFDSFLAGSLTFTVDAPYQLAIKNSNGHLSCNQEDEALSQHSKDPILSSARIAKPQGAMRDALDKMSRPRTKSASGLDGANSHNSSIDHHSEGLHERRRDESC